MWFLLQLIDHNIHESNEVTALAPLSGRVSGFFLFSVLFIFVCFLFQPWCRLITTIYNYFVVTNFFWMFVEGCYLHTAIVMTYSTDKLRKWVFLFIGWCECVRVDSTLWTLVLTAFTVYYTIDVFSWRMETASVYSLLNPQFFSPRGVSQSKFDDVLCEIMLIHYITAGERQHEGRNDVYPSNFSLNIFNLVVKYRLR